MADGASEGRPSEGRVSFGLPAHTLDTLRRIIGKYGGVRQAVVYGSRAKGTYRPGSDIDLALHTTAAYTHDDLARLRDDLYMSDIGLVRQPGWCGPSVRLTSPAKRSAFCCF